MPSALSLALPTSKINVPVPDEDFALSGIEKTMCFGGK